MSEHVLKKFSGQKYEMQPTWIQDTLMLTAFMLCLCQLHLMLLLWKIFKTRSHINYFSRYFSHFTRAISIFFGSYQQRSFHRLLIFYLDSLYPTLSLDFSQNSQKLQTHFVRFKTFIKYLLDFLRKGTTTPSKPIQTSTKR